MKKGFLILLVLLAIVLAGIYAFIPSGSIVSAAAGIKSSQDAAFRVISDEQTWKSWWPGEVKQEGTFSYAGKDYTISNKVFQGLQLNVSGVQASGVRVVLLPVSTDSFLMEWKTSWHNGVNPVSRWQRHNEGQQFQNELAAILQSFKKYVENTANVYGNTITQGKVTDSIILMLSANTPSYPTVKQVYDAVGKLKALAASGGAKETNFPMLNVDSTERGFLMRVGLPVNKEVNVSGTNVEVKRMVLGLILISDIKGGRASVNKGMENVERYMVDFKRRAPAIPFESMVTDRSAEPDTSKWVTRIYYPVY